ncbi:MAG: hypothetical protein RL199_2123, partial [Pseudomonadota bacterium]
FRRNRGCGARKDPDRLVRTSGRAFSSCSGGLGDSWSAECRAMPFRLLRRLRRRPRGPSRLRARSACCSLRGIAEKRGRPLRVSSMRGGEWRRAARRAIRWPPAAVCVEAREGRPEASRSRPWSAPPLASCSCCSRGASFQGLPGGGRAGGWNDRGILSGRPDRGNRGIWSGTAAFFVGIGAAEPEKTPIGSSGRPDELSPVVPVVWVIQGRRRAGQCPSGSSVACGHGTARGLRPLLAQGFR